jgi:hypothetical protein
MDLEILGFLPQSLEPTLADNPILDVLPCEDLAENTGGQRAVMIQVLLFLVSLLDDALLLGLSRLGINIPYLKWLAPIIFVALSYQWIRHLYHFVKHRYFVTIERSAI